MSLLLEALKKAERAKEEAQRRARGESEPASTSAPPSEAASPLTPAKASPLALQGEMAPEAESKRVLTRSELPDINQPLSIEGEDLAPNSKAPPRPREELKLETPKEAPRRPAAAAAAAAQAADREAGKNTARKVFEAKFREPNPKLPFYITMGLLGAFAVGIVIYFYMQLRPPYPLVNASPPRPTGETQVAAAAPAPLAPSAAPASAIPGLPGTPAAAPAPSATPAVPRPQAAAPTPGPGPERPLLSPAPRLASPSVNAPRAPAAQAPAPGPEVTVNRAGAQLNPKVESGYAAYQAGDLAKARADYEQALADDPNNRDALLGLAAIETRSGRYDAAEAGYLRMLQVDPRDANAQAGLLALRAARQDPLASESHVKSLLAQAPGAHVLNFTLGNQFAQQGRWAEAQQEYFKAFAGDPENADFAYNLAVSLDHLRQPRLARDYYLRAVVLAEKRSGAFDIAAARNRASQLGN
ncbi:MAG TPA: tetratricopeptide repeat protein [Burkholderiales bacterium]|jgi:Tfp pilus assembly protein PilF